MCGGQVMREDLGVDILHECFTEGGVSILGVFACEPSRKKLQED